ncbi:hypothetical protein Bca4012_077031 [Brassica carinata]
MENDHVGPFNLGNPGEFTMLELAEVAQAGVHIFFKLAISNRVSVRVLLAYRFLLSTAVMVPLAFFFNRQALS